MSLMIMLPTQRHGLDKLLQDLTSEYLMKSFDYSPKDDRKNLELTLPAFHINSSITNYWNIDPLGKEIWDDLKNYAETNCYLAPEDGTDRMA